MSIYGDKFTRCTKERYWDMLEVLSPAVMGGCAFMVGEPSNHCLKTGHPTFMGFYEKGGNYYEAKHDMTIREFRRIGRQIGFTAEDCAYGEKAPNGI